MEQGTSISELSMTGTRDLQPDNVPAKTVTDGYEKLAELMSLKPETAIFRRFQTLIVTNLLRLQAELQDMEHELAEIRSDDAQSQDAIRKGYRYDFRSMRDWKETGDSLQYDLLVAIGEKLAEYNTALSQALTSSKAARPEAREVRFLRDWLARPSLGNDFLNDIERCTWEDANDPDFLTLFPRTIQKDVFTSFLNGALLDVYHRLWGHKRK
ncbi:MAG: hypothetical protein LQ349_007332, partial [Xanthoria aureola]